MARQAAGAELRAARSAYLGCAAGGEGVDAHGVRKGRMCRMGRKYRKCHKEHMCRKEHMFHMGRMGRMFRMERMGRMFRMGRKGRMFRRASVANTGTLAHHVAGLLARGADTHNAGRLTDP